MKTIISWLIRYVPRKYLQRVSGVGMKVLSVVYRGSSVMCPVCGWSFKKFLPYGRINTRQNALCPHCLSLERHRLIWLFLQKKTDYFKAQHDVLHIAPEACFMDPMETLNHRRYITADIESPLAKVKMDIHAMPFNDNSFDLVLCNHVLEHVQDDIKAVSEITRVLRPGGLAILQVPFFRPIPDKTFEDPSVTDKREREKLFGQDDHVRRYGHDYPQRLQRGGLVPMESNFVSEMTVEERQKYGLVEGEIIYGGRKQS
ncbi:MAG: class I SAM-dependent methyltransferase [Chryseolinea sp.]